MIFYIILGLIIFVVSFFSTLSGGIGLLTRPILILAGYPPTIAIGSFRVANLFSRLAGVPAFMQNKKTEIDWKLSFLLIVPSLIGGAIGAELVHVLNEGTLRKILGCFILIMAILLLIRRDIGLKEKTYLPSKYKNVIGFFVTIFVGIVASFIGGSGFLFAYLLILNYHKTFLSSAPVRKIANFGSALSASILFIYQGNIDWTLALVVFIGDSLGEYLGTRYQITKGEAWVRNVTVAVIFIGAITMLFY